MQNTPCSYAMHPLASQAPLQVVPVLDLLAGKVVRGIAGRRSEYRPWLSPLCPKADPLEAAPALRDAVGHRDLYVADIGAIGGAQPEWNVLQSLASDAALWCDIGVCNSKQARQLAATLGAGGQAGRVILASETMPSLADILEVIDQAPDVQFAFSLDWVGDQLRSPGGWLSSNNWLDVAAALADAGVERFVLIDLNQVGTRRAVQIAPACRRLRHRLPTAHLTAGGGVAGPEDLHVLAEAGCDAALVASALHQPRDENFG